MADVRCLSHCERINIRRRVLGTIIRRTDETNFHSSCISIVVNVLLVYCIDHYAQDIKFPCTRRNITITIPETIPR